MPPPDETPPSAWIELPDKRTHVLARDSYIGRIDGNEIVVPDHRISRRHAVVRCEGRRFVIVDLGSTNGTFVNETRIFRPTVLNDADVITVGGQRFVFCQPVVAGEAADDAVASTAVVVAKTPCWMLFASVAGAADTAGIGWIDRMAEAVVESGGRIKRLSEASLFCHWRADLVSSTAMRTVISGLAQQPRPTGARITFHHGMVRVGPGATPAEENLLGADVAFTHKLDSAAVTFGAGFLLSAAAVQSLDLRSQVTPLGSHAVRDTPGTHEVFALR